MMQCATQFNSCPATIPMEQRDDFEYKTVSELPRDPPSHHPTHVSSGEHWSKRLTGSSPCYQQGYQTYHDGENSKIAANNNATASISSLSSSQHVIDKLKSIQVPKSLFAPSSSLDNDLISTAAPTSNINTTVSLSQVVKRKHLMSMIHSNSDKIAAETTKSWNVLLEKTTEMKHSYWTEHRKAAVSSTMKKMQNPLEIIRRRYDSEENNCGNYYHEGVGEKKHVREVSFDYQLMNDTDYSSSPSCC
jgi:hypothetical protein